MLLFPNVAIYTLPFSLTCMKFHIITEKNILDYAQKKTAPSNIVKTNFLCIIQYMTVSGFSCFMLCIFPHSGKLKC